MPFFFLLNKVLQSETLALVMAFELYITPTFVLTVDSTTRMIPVPTIPYPVYQDILLQSPKTDFKTKESKSMQQMLRYSDMWSIELTNPQKPWILHLLNAR